MAKTPKVTWAQREDNVYVTIHTPDATNVDVKIREDGFDFSCKSGPDNEEYAVNLDLLRKIDPAKSSWRQTGRDVQLNLVKVHDQEALDGAKDDKEEEMEIKFWPRLSKLKGLKFISVDWDKWVDADELANADVINWEDDFGGMNFGDQFNLNDMGGDDDDDDDDDDGVVYGSDGEDKEEEEEEKKDILKDLDD